MKVAEMKIDSTSVAFYDDFSDISESSLNIICFENALRIMLESVLIR